MTESIFLRKLDINKSNLVMYTSYCDWEHPLFSRQENNELIKRVRFRVWFDDLHYLAKSKDKIIITGLEPFNQYEEIKSLIDYFKECKLDTKFIIHTGLSKKALRQQLNELKQFDNVSIIFGRGDS